MGRGARARREGGGRFRGGLSSSSSRRSRLDPRARNRRLARRLLRKHVFELYGLRRTMFQTGLDVPRDVAHGSSARRGTVSTSSSPPLTRTAFPSCARSPRRCMTSSRRKSALARETRTQASCPSVQPSRPRLGEGRGPLRGSAGTACLSLVCGGSEIRRELPSRWDRWNASHE